MMKADDFPRRIEIEFTNACNSKCVYCPRTFGVGEEGFMRLGLYKKIIDEAKPHHETTLQLHRRGESLLHPDFTGMLLYTKGLFKEVQLATNAILLDKDKSELISQVVTFISFSIDLPDKYHLKRGVDAYKSVHENIDYFLKINRKAKTQVSMVKDPSVKDEDVEKFKELWIGKVDTIRVYEEHSVGGVYGATRVKRDKRMPCAKPFTDMVIYWNGKVVRCNHDWSNRPLGDVNTHAIGEIWMNEEFKRLRGRQVSLDFRDEDVCSKCDSWYSQEGRQETGYIFKAADKEI